MKDNPQVKTAKQAGLGQCLKCHKLNVITHKDQRCTCCQAKVSLRKYRSLEYTLAWTIAAVVAFIPANLYPIMIFTSLGNPEASTILSGIESFIQLGMYPVALVVFIASFIVPLGKMLGLLILIVTVKTGSKVDPKHRTQLYHLVEFLGPWSMLDVFVVALMAAVVNLGFITSIEAGPGASYFALMVIFTMFAAESFDPRLLWDNQNNDD
ncbi:paraquat-inducible protein A [Thalassomonas viridans]|uniref:Paraquat-inducible protein A n=1 Tax=Thalassomonas viridans TaxID=137584 RepID=A0AAF0C993_9GAMM|nr:paraquat-inducible protein A [Thalassomonas viridans]WDE05236.1 paraquat-inducible protein A [Thalassomonas viridans]